MTTSAYRKVRRMESIYLLTSRGFQNLFFGTHQMRPNGFFASLLCLMSDRQVKYIVENISASTSLRTQVALTSKFLLFLNLGLDISSFISL